MKQPYDVITLFSGDVIRGKIINEGVNSYMVQKPNYACHPISKVAVTKVERANASR